MPTGPDGEKRPSDFVGSVITVAKIATGEIEEIRADQAKSKAGKKGGKARSKTLTAERRSAIASNAANARWAKSK